MPDSSGKGPDLAPGQQLGNYTIVRKLGEGGMGAVYEANQAGINRRVALKVLPQTLMQNQVFLERFMREAQSAGALNHPNIVTVHEVVQDQGYYFFSMEYVDGQTLREWLKRTGRMSADDALKIIRKVAQALHYAWQEARIIHRDIKPDNIMLTRQGEVKVADLGLAKSTAQDATVTADGTGIGTPAYMSPEQSRGAKDIDCRADIYSLGITLFQMLTAQLPFEAETPYAVIAAHLEQPLPDPKSISPEIPDSVSALIQRMCAKDPSQRYEAPAQLVDEIDAIARPGAAGPTQPIQTEAFRQQPTIPISQRRRRAPKSRSRTPAILAALIGLVIIGGLGYMMFGRGGPGVPTTTTTIATTTTVKGVVAISPAQAKEMFEYAMTYAKEHPDEFPEIINKFEEVRIETKGTVFAMQAADQIREWRRNWDDAGAAEIEKRRPIADRHVADADFVKARAVWEDFPKGLLTDATRDRANAEMARIETAVHAFAQNLKRQAAPFLAKRPGQLTAADITALTALKAKADRPPAGLDAAGKAALAALAGQIGQALAARQEHLAALRAEALEELWNAYEPQMKGKGFDRAAVLVRESEGKNDAKVGALLAKDTPLVAGLFAKAKENLPHLKGKTIRIGGMAMTVADVKDGKVIVKQDAAQMAFAMDKLGRETVLMLALMGEKGPGLLVRQKALFAFYYGRESEIVAKLREAEDAGADLAFYLSRLRPVLVVMSVPPGSSVAVEVKRDGAWQKVPVDAQETPARCEVPGRGSYRVKVSRKGYLTATREVTVRDAGELKLVFSLKKAGLWPPVRDGLVLHYSFDEADDRAEDKSGKGNHGTLHEVKWTEDGKVGGAYEFDGKTAYIQRAFDGGDLFPTNTPFSVAAWVRAPAFDTDQPVILSTHYSGISGGYYLAVNAWNGGGQLAWAAPDQRGETTSRRPINDGRWHQVTAVWNGTDRSLYLDGVLQGAARADGPLSYPHRAPFRVGHSHNANRPGSRSSKYFFKGTIDEVMVYDRALSAEEAKALHEGTPMADAGDVAAGYDAGALLAAGFEVPREAKDQHGNPIRKGSDAATDLPPEIRHKKTGMHLVFIPAGEFMMGSPPGERGREGHEGPQHLVRLTRPFYLGKYEVTQPEWKVVTGDSPSKFPGANSPVEQVSWFECQDFVKKLGRAPARGNAGVIFSLPTEAQWEYACRAGTQARYHFGERAELLDDYAWHSRNSGQRAHPVGRKAPNPWGLFDMYGNVWEWCTDWYGPYAEREATDPQGPPAGTKRVLRGSGWYAHDRGPSSAWRHSTQPTVHFNNVGLRVALAIPVGGGQGPPIRNGLVLYYPFDEAGDRAEDKSGKGNYGTLRGVKWTKGGKFGGAYEFDGKTAYIQRDYDQRSAIYADTSPLTFALWFRTAAPAPRQPMLVSTHLAGAKNGYFLCLSEQAGGKAYWWIAHGQTESRTSVSDGRWHQAAVVWNGRETSFYIDAVLQGSAATQGTASYTPRAPFRIGHSRSNAGELSIYYFRGTIDEVMVFNRALSAAEVKALFEWEPELGAMAPPRRIDVKALLAAGLEVPKTTRDRYGNPVRKGADEQTEAPLEIRHKKTGMHFVFVPAGEFMMGSPPHERDRQNDEGPVHKVHITKPFYLGKYEVTVGDFKLFSKESRFTTDAERMKNGRAWQGANWVTKPDASWRNPYFKQDDRHPACFITWNDTSALIRWLNRGQRNLFDLATEAEWEYACRAGTTSRFFWGDEEARASKYANVADAALKRSCPQWVYPKFPADDRFGYTAPIGSFEPNRLGLYDTIGNVWEWCSDWHGRYSTREVDDPRGPAHGTLRIIRGGSWSGGPQYSRPARRHKALTTEGMADIGCRLCVRPPFAE